MSRQNKIQKWIQEGEGSQLDFKLSITSPAKIAKTIVAFANSRGGNIVVGVEDHGHIFGVNVPEEEYQLKKAAEKFCSNSIKISFEPYEYNNRYLLIASIAESDRKPHFAIDNNGNKKVYVRIADKCVVPNQTILDILNRGDMNRLERTSFYWDVRKELLEYLAKNKTINIAQYMDWRKCSERSAQRSLLDFLFEGAIKLKSENPLVFF